MTAQRAIYESVIHRGSRDGWTPEQFAARQVAKLAEELGELCACIHADAGEPLDWEEDLMWLTYKAREWFDDGEMVGDAAIEAPYDAIDELADIVVVACCLAEALAEHEPGMDVDLMSRALTKARRDVERGVR